MRNTAIKTYKEICNLKAVDWVPLIGFPVFLFGFIFLAWLACVHIGEAWGQSVVQFVFGIVGFLVAAALAAFCIGVGCMFWKDTIRDVVWRIRYAYDETTLQVKEHLR